MQFTKSQLIILSIGGFLVIFFSLVFLGVIPGSKKEINRPNIELQFWGVGDDYRAWSETIAKFENLYPNVKVKYTKFDSANYEKQLIDALAAGGGPDIFMFHNTWLPKHANKIVPVNQKQFNLSAFRNLFPMVAEQDFVKQDQIFALPLYIDTLALIYNRDIFDNKRIALTPTTWDELKAVILKVREFSAGGLSKAALAIGGTTKSIANATDILSLLMLQHKTEMISSDGSRASIANPQGIAALNFYTQFSNPKSIYYTWSESFKPSLESFARKQVAMILAYAADLPEIKSRNPVLNFAVGLAPQFDKKEAVNFANYWGLAVSAKTYYSKEAWDFVLLAATDTGLARNYLQATGKPPALRSLINEYLSHPDLGVFAAQALTARSWKQIDNLEIRRIFDNLIALVMGGKLPAYKALRSAEDELNFLMQR